VVLEVFGVGVAVRSGGRLRRVVVRLRITGRAVGPIKLERVDGLEGVIPGGCIGGGLLEVRIQAVRRGIDRNVKDLGRSG
jgi:hypothetical protein